MSRGNVFFVLLSVLVLACMAAPPQAQAQITLVDSGTLTYNANQTNTINTTINPLANVFVVDIDWRTPNGTPTVTYGGQAMTPAVVQLGTTATYINSAIYYLAASQTGWQTGTSLPLVVNVGTQNGTVSDVAIDSFSLGGVNLNLLPSSGSAGTTNQIDNESSPNPLPLTVGTAIVPGSWANYTTDYRQGSGNLLNATITGGNGTLIAAGQSTSQLGQFWDVNPGNSVDAGALVSNIQSSSLTVTESNSGGAAGTHWTMVGAVFAPKPTVIGGLVWAGSAGSAVWDIGTTPNWQSASGLYTEPDTLGVVFDDTAGSVAGATNVVVGQVVSPKAVTFNNFAYPYTLTSQSGGAISGTGAVSVVGGGLVTFQLGNTYSGGTNISSGNLATTVDNALGSGTVSVVPGGTLSLSSQTPTINGLLGGGNVVLGNAFSGPTNLTVNNTINTTFSGAITEAGSLGVNNILTKTGPNTLTLTGVSSYAGGTVINQGTIAASISSLGTGPVTIGNGTKLALLQGGVVLNGFSAFSNFNGYASAGTAVTNNVLTLTDNVGGEARSAWTTSTLPVTSAGFTASFVYRDVTTNGADGFTFTLQNSGPGALGGNGGNVGYSGITPSAAVMFDIYNGGSYNSRTGFGTAGSVANLGQFTTTAGTPNAVNLSKGDPILVTLSYNGAAQTLTENLFDQTTGSTAIYTYTGVNYSTALSGTSAYVGFTAGTGGQQALQTISNFQFIDGAGGSYPSVVIPASASSELNYALSTAGQTNVAGITLNSLSTLNVTSSGAANGTFQINSGALGLNGNATINVNNNGTGLGTLVAGVVSGAGNITKGGAGTLLMSSSLSNFIGNTIINAGNVAVTNAASLGGNGNNVIINNGALEVATSFTDTTPITFNAPGAALQVDANQTYSNSTTFAVANGGAVTKTGPGTLFMTTPLPAAPMVANGGIFDLGGLTHAPTTATFTSGTVQDGTLTANSYLVNGPGTVSANLLDGMAPSTLTVNFSTSGVATLSSTANLYSGGTVIQKGTLAALYQGSLGSGAVTLAGGKLQVAGGQAGLQEGWFGSNFDTGDAFTSSLFQSVQLSPRAANWTTAINNNLGSSISPPGFTNNTTVAYQGYMWIGAAAGSTVSFLQMFDDNKMLILSGSTLINNGNYNTVANANWVVPASGPGYYPIQIRYGQGGGGVGPNSGYTIGFGYDANGSGGTVQSNYIFPTDPGNGSVFTAYAPGISNFTNPLNVTASSGMIVAGGPTFPSLTFSPGAALEVSGTSSSLVITGITNVASGSSFNVDSTMNVNLLSLLSDGGAAQAITKTGAGALTLQGANSFTAGTNFQISGGSLVAVGQSYLSPGPATGPLGSAPVTLTNAGLVLAATTTASATTFDMVSGNAVTLAGTNDSITAGSTLGVGLPGATINLVGSNTIAIPAGHILNLGANNTNTLNIGLAFGNSGTINVPVGSISLAASNLAYSGGTFTAVSGGSLTLTSPVTAGTYSPASQGTVYLSNSYSGSLANLAPASGGTLVVANNLTAGTLNVANGADIATSSTSFGPTTLSLNGGSLGAMSALSVANPLILGATPTLSFAGNAVLTLTSSLSVPSGTFTVNDPGTHGNLAGTISGSGNLSINGYPTLSGSNTYSGGTSLNSNGNDGMTVTNNQAFGTGLITFNNGGFNASAALTGANAIPNAWIIPNNETAYFYGTNAFQLSGNAALPTGTEYIQIPNNSQGLSVTLSGLISGTGATLVRSNNGNGNNNSINGTLVINNPGNTFANFTLQSQGGNVDVQGASTVVSNGTIQSGPLGIGTITIGNGNSHGIGILNSSPFPVTIANALTITDSAAYWSVSGINFSGPVALSNNVNYFYLGTNTLANSAAFSNSNITFSGIISGGTAAGINLASGSGAGGLTLSSTASTYAGPTSVSYGTLIAGNNVPINYNSPFGKATSAITIGDSTSTGLPAAVVLGGPLSLGYAIMNDRPITVNATAGPTTLGDITAGDALLPSYYASNGNGPGGAFGGVITLNNSGSVTLSAANGGSVTFDALNHTATGYGTITGSGGITAASAGNGNVTLVNTNSYTGRTTVSSGQLTLNYAAVGPVGAATTVGGIIPPTSPVTLSGGTLSIQASLTASVNETFKSTQISGFGSTVLVNDPNSVGVQVNLGNITRNGGALDLPVYASVFIPGQVSSFTTTSPNVNGILGGYVTVNGYTDWAANDGSGNVVPVSTVAGFSYNNDDYSLPANNVDVISNLTPTLSATTTINSLRFNTTPNGNVDLGGNTLVLQGGILVTPTSGTNGIINGTLTSAGTSAINGLADILVQQGNTAAPFTIGANITNNGTISVGLTKAGPGTLILGGSNTFSGPISVAAGSLQGSLGTGSFPATTTSISVNAGANVTFMENGPTPVSTAIAITGAGSLTKAGSQTLSSYGAVPQGGLNVLGGTYQLNGSAAIAGPVFVGPSGTLAMGYASGLVGKYYANQNINQTNFNSLANLNAAFNPQTPTLIAPSTAGGQTNFNFMNANGNAYGNQFVSQGFGVNGVQTNNYCVRWDGQINITTAGTYEFGTNSDDGSMVYIDGSVVVNNNAYQGTLNGNPNTNPANNQQTGSVTLTPGLHQITVAYYQGGGGAGLNVDYSTNAGTTWNFLPNSMLVGPLGSASMGVGDLSGSGVVSLAGTLTETATTGSEFDGTLTGTGVFLKAGAGTLVMTNSNNTLNGSVRIGSGILQLSGPQASSVLANVTLDMNFADSGTLGTTGLSSLTLGGLMGTRNLAALSPAGPLTVGGNNTSTTYSGNLSGVTTLIKTGLDTLYLSGSNSYSSAIVLQGVLEPATTAALPPYATANGVSVAGGASVTVQTGSAAWNAVQIGTLLTSGSWAANSGLGIDTTNGSVALTSPIINPVVLSKLGPNSLTLTSPSTYTGGTIVQAGVLTAGHDAALGTGPLTVAAGATVNFPTANPSVNGLQDLVAGSGGSSVVLGTAGSNATNLTVNSNTNSTFSGLISEAQGPSTLTKTGPATLSLLTLGGSSSYSGGTTVKAGVLASGPNGIGTGNINLAGGTFQAVGATVASTDLSVGGTTTAGSHSLSGNQMTITGYGNDFWGGTEQGHYVYTAVPTNQNFDVAVHVLNMSTLNTDGWAKIGIMARQDVSTNNDPAIMSAETWSNACGLQYTSAAQNTTGFGISQGPEWVRLTYNATTQLFTGYEDQLDSGSAAAPGASSPNWVSMGSYTVSMTGSTFLLGVGDTSHNNADSMTSVLDNLGTLLPYLSPANYANNVVVSANSTLSLGSLGGSSFGGLTLNPGVTLTVTATGTGYQATFGATSVVGSAALVVANNGAGLGTVAVGALSGTGNLVMNGPGTLYLSSSANGFTGPVTLNAGTLVVANSTNGSATGSGLLTLNGGTLASDPNLGGTIGGSVTFGSGAHQIAPGGVGTVGNLAIGGNLSINSQSTLDFDVNGNNNTADLLDVSGAFSVSGIANMALSLVGTTVPTASPIVLATFPTNNSLTSANFHATGVPFGYTLQVDPTNLELVASNVTGPVTWTGGTGMWSLPPNWSPTPQNAPSGPGVAAVVGADTSTPLTVTLDEAVTLGQLTFSSAGGAGYTLAGPNTLTMDNSPNAPAPAQILVASGSHSIANSVTVLLAGALSIVPSAGTTLDLAANVNEVNPGMGSISLDGPGTLILSGTNNYTGPAGTAITAGGTLIVTNGAALPNNTNLTVGTGTFIYDPSVAGAPATGGGVSSGAMVAAVPEPGTLALLLAGLVVGLGVAWRKRKGA